MALIPQDRYPGGSIEGDAGYPLGRARNITQPGDGTGYPWEQDGINDLLGFQQALLDAAGITPTGNPDAVGASQYLDAIRALTSKPSITVVASGATAHNDYFDLAVETETPGSGYSISGGGRTVLPPSPGYYHASLTGQFADIASPGASELHVNLILDNAVFLPIVTLDIWATRPGPSAMNLSGGALFYVPSLSTFNFRLRNVTADIVNAQARLTLTRIALVSGW